MPLFFKGQCRLIWACKARKDSFSDVMARWLGVSILKQALKIPHDLVLHSKKRGQDFDCLLLRTNRQEVCKVANFLWQLKIILGCHCVDSFWWRRGRDLLTPLECHPHCTPVFWGPSVNFLYILPIFSPFYDIYWGICYLTFPPWLLLPSLHLTFSFIPFPHFILSCNPLSSPIRPLARKKCCFKPDALCITNCNQTQLASALLLKYQKFPIQKTRAESRRNVSF